MPTVEQIEQVETMYGTFWARTNDLMTKQLREYSAHTRNELAMLGSVLREGDNIIDVGAHIGTFSIPFARFTKGKGKIFSFEANPQNYDLLAKNVAANHLEGIVNPINALVSVDTTGSYEMGLPDDGNTGAYYFKPVATASATATPAISIDQWYAQIAGQVPKIALLKVDVEGAEVSVLRSCRQLISEQKPMLYIEVCKSALQRFGSSIQDIEELLAPYGYHYFRNVGARNSANDNFKTAQLNSISEGGVFYDLLAVHPSDSRYPTATSGGMALTVAKLRSSVGEFLVRFTHPDADSAH